MRDWRYNNNNNNNNKIKINRTIILPVVLYGCETWSLTLREERRLRVFENRVLRRVFWPKRDEVTGNGENYIMSLGSFTLLLLYGSTILVGPWPLSRPSSSHLFYVHVSSSL